MVRDLCQNGKAAELVRNWYSLLVEVKETSHGSKEFIGGTQELRKKCLGGRQ